MVATPKFHVTQDADWVFVHVHVPFIRVSDMEFYVDGAAFTFYCKPYLLKLHFPYEVVENELTKAVYDPNKENGTIVIQLLKKVPGQDFPDLDMLTKLLQPQRPRGHQTTTKPRSAPLIEVLDSSKTDLVGTLQEETDRLNALIDGKCLHDTVATENASVKHVKSDASLLNLEVGSRTDNDAEGSEAIRVTHVAPSYGFNNAYSNFFRVWHGDARDIVSLPNPDHVPPHERCRLRERAEDKLFDIERYLMDVAHQQDDMYFQLAMAYTPFWHNYPVVLPASANLKRNCKGFLASSGQVDTRLSDHLNHLVITNASPTSVGSTTTVFTDLEHELLLRLPRKEYLLPRGSFEETHVLGGLVDLLIALAYEQLTTQGDSGVESTWTVAIVSPTLSWLDSTGDLRAVVRATIRRMLTFPFLRQYDLAVRCVQEVSDLLKRGKRVVLKALLTLYRIVEKSETQYLLNILYIQDYCVWIQSVTDARLLQVSFEVKSHIDAFTKSETGWALDELERSLVDADGEASSLSCSCSEVNDGTSSDEESSRNDSREDDVGVVGTRGSLG